MLGCGGPCMVTAPGPTIAGGVACSIMAWLVGERFEPSPLAFQLDPRLLTSIVELMKRFHSRLEACGVDLTPEGAQPNAPGDHNQNDFSPRYRLYSFQASMAKVLELQQSPHARRRRYLVLGDNTIQESTV